MKYVYTFFAIIAITIISIFTFKEDLVHYYYAKYTVKDEIIQGENNYFYTDNFAYLDNYTSLEIHNKKELYETIYYVVNSGITNTQRYFNVEYTDFETDYNELFNDQTKLNVINNFVHPYNSFSSIEVSLKGYLLEIKINYNELYSEEKKEKINNEVDNIINKYLKNSMSDREKIEVIHDYIVNNTKYDKDFCTEEDQSKCETTSIYEADTAYGVLFEHYGICSGYTDLMAIFLNRLGITNFRVTNDTHTWNAVYLNNVWYHLDVTWDDPINDEDILSHDYFLITTEKDENLDQSHTFSKEIFSELS